MNKTQAWSPLAHSEAPSCLGAPIVAQDLQHCTEMPQKPETAENKEPSILLCCRWMFYHLNTLFYPSAAVIRTCWYFNALSWFAALVFPDLEAQSPGVMQVLSHRPRAHGAAGAEPPGQGWQSPPPAQ